MSGRLYEVWAKGNTWRAISTYDEDERKITIAVSTGTTIGPATPAIRLAGQDALFDSRNVHEDVVTLAKPHAVKDAIQSWRQKCRHDGFSHVQTEEESR